MATRSDAMSLCRHTPSGHWPCRYGSPLGDCLIASGGAKRSPWTSGVPSLEPLGRLNASFALGAPMLARASTPGFAAQRRGYNQSPKGLPESTLWLFTQDGPVVVPFAPEAFAGAAGLDEVPGQQLLDWPGAGGVEGHVQAHLGEGLLPQFEAEVLVPAVKTCPGPPGGLDGRAQAAVAAGDDAFQQAPLDAVELARSPASGGTGRAGGCAPPRSTPRRAWRADWSGVCGLGTSQRPRPSIGPLLVVDGFAGPGQSAGRARRCRRCPPASRPGSRP